MWARSELCLRYIEDMRKRESPPHRVQRGDYPSDCVNRKLRDFSRSFFIYVLTL